MIYNEPQLKALVGKITSLPTIEDMGMKVLEMALNPDVSVSELSNAIHHDPSLAARVLKVANSPTYGMTRQIDSLGLAIATLGLCEVRNIALGLSLFDAIKRMNSSAVNYRLNFWHHSAGCGTVARILGSKLNFRSEGADFLVGLLHDMGKIIIDRYFGAEFDVIFNNTITRRRTMLEAEREFLGETHDHVGGWLAEKWLLPDTIRDAVVHHHDFPSVETLTPIKAPRLVALAYLAEAFCQHYRVGWDGDSGCCDIRDPKVWKALLSGQDRYMERDIDLILTETLQVLNAARPYIFFV